jgi:hypothetical protein
MRNSKPKPISHGSLSSIFHSSLFIVNSAACGSFAPPPPRSPANEQLTINNDVAKATRILRRQRLTPCGAIKKNIEKILRKYIKRININREVENHGKTNNCNIAGFNVSCRGKNRTWPLFEI